MSARFLVDGVPQGGVIVGDIGQEVPESRICSYFGPKSSKSGWKYQARTSLEEQDAILSLYRRVYECQDIPNKEITVQFARGLILMSEGTKVDWEEFRVSRRKYREGLRRKKELTRQFVKSEKEGEGSVPSIIGKRRCLASQGGFGDDFPPSLKLTVKSEGASEGLVAPMGKRGGGKGRPLNVSPAWIQGDIDDMVRVIGDRSVLLDSLRVSLGEVTKVQGQKEDSLRRAKLMREDRTVMIAECTSEIERIDAEELSLRARMEERSVLLESLGSGNSSLSEKEASLAQQSTDERECEALCASRIDEQRSGRRSRQIVIECDQTIGYLEKELEATCDEHNNLSQKVEALEKQAVDMEEQLRMMREGFGDTFWPMPIDQCPELPIHLVHTLNPCPVCHLWYSCWDYVPIGCGHCYHPWCLAEHAKVSSKCLLRECGKPFDRRHEVALGIRIPVKASVISVKKEVLHASHSFPAATEKRKGMYRSS